MELSVEQLSTHDIYRLLIGAVQPRPIAWVCSQDSANRLNLAPFSFFTVASVQPPVVAFVPLLDGSIGEKDTLKNIRQTEEFTLNIVSHSIVEQMNKTSATLPHGESEIAYAGLSTISSETIDVPRIKEALVHFECTLRSVQSFGDEALAGRLVLGDIKHIHIADEIYDNGRIDQIKLETVGRLAGNVYSTTRDTFEINRP